MDRRPIEQPTFYDDPVTTFLGTLGESAIDQLTFGIAEPDIIPEERERLNPTAAMIGHMAGNVAGFVGSIAALGVPTRAALMTTTFGKGLLKYGTGKAALGASAAFRGTAGAVQTGATFGLYDLTREVVRQTTEKDPSLFEAARAATVGLTTGAIFGFGQDALMMMNPATQVLGGAGVGVMAEALAAKLEGRDPSREELATAGLTMGILSALGAKGTKKRLAERDQMLYDRLPALMDDVAERGEPAVRDVLHKLGATDEQIKANLPKIKVFTDALKRKTPRVPEGRGGDPVFEQAKGRRSKWKVLGYKNEKGGVPVLAKLKQIKDKKGEVIFEMPEETYRGFISTVSWGRTTTSKQLTRQEYSEAVDMAKEYIRGEMNRAVADLGVNPAVIPQRLQGMDMSTRNIERSIEIRAMGDLIEPIRRAAYGKDVELQVASEGLSGAIGKWKRSHGEDIKVDVKSWWKKDPTPAEKKLWDILNIADEQQLAQAMNALTEEQRGIVKTLRRFTDFYLERANQARKANGLPEIKKREGYMHHMYDPEGLQAVEITTQEGVIAPIGSRMKEAYNVTWERRVKSKKLRAELDKIVVKNPLGSLLNMVRYDLKDIYLTQPTKVLDAQLTAMEKSGLLGTAGEAQRLRKDIKYISDTFAYSRATPGAERANRALENMLKGGKIEKAVDFMLGIGGGKHRLKDVSRPMDAISSVYGRLVHTAYITGRPAYGFRNLTQVFLDMSHVSWTAAVKGFGKTPELLKRIVNNSPLIKYNLQSYEEASHPGAGHAATVLNMPQSASQQTTITYSAKANYHDAVEMITLAKNDKYNWWDAAGKEARRRARESGDKNWKNIFSPDEERTIARAVEWGVQHNQFIYSAWGMPAMNRNPALGMFTKLQSFPMNYAHNYLGNSWSMLRDGKPGFDTTGRMTIPMSKRLALFKHFLFVGGVIYAAEKAGYDYSEISGISFSPSRKEKGKTFGLQLGVFNFRPSPAHTMLTALRNVFSDNPYEAALAKKQLAMGPVPIPGMMMAKDYAKVYKSGELKDIYLKRHRDTKKKYPFKPVSSPYKGLPKLRIGGF